MRPGDDQAPGYHARHRESLPRLAEVVSSTVTSLRRCDMPPANTCSEGVRALPGSFGCEVASVPPRFRRAETRSSRLPARAVVAVRPRLRRRSRASPRRLAQVRLWPHPPLPSGLSWLSFSRSAVRRLASRLRRIPEPCRRPGAHRRRCRSSPRPHAFFEGGLLRPRTPHGGFARPWRDTPTTSTTAASRRMLDVIGLHAECLPREVFPCRPVSVTECTIG
jgi:hypothetical protein